VQAYGSRRYVAPEASFIAEPDFAGGSTYTFQDDSTDRDGVIVSRPLEL
jgi:hypothetical protein